MNIDLKRPFKTSSGRVAISAALALASATAVLGTTYPGGVSASNVYCNCGPACTGPSLAPTYCSIFYSNDTYCASDWAGNTWITGAVCN